MKRFFLLTAILRHVPMYSDDTDLIWHEMLMFTREYQRFCEDFAGFYIHHQPNVNPAAAAGEALADQRAVFELVYSALFEIAPENGRLLGRFHRSKPSPGLIDELESADARRVHQALGLRDSADPAVLRAQDATLARILDQTLQARAYHGDGGLGKQSPHYGGVDPLWGLLAFGMATQLSPFSPDDAARERDREDSSSSAVYAGAPYDDDRGDGGGHDGGGHDGGGHGHGDGGSSCSSSDGGGGSSCGGGCGGGGS